MSKVRKPRSQGAVAAKLRGGAGVHADRRTRRTSRGSARRHAILESLGY